MYKDFFYKVDHQGLSDLGYGCGGERTLEKKINHMNLPFPPPLQGGIFPLPPPLPGGNSPPLFSPSGEGGGNFPPQNIVILAAAVVLVRRVLYYS